MIIELNGISVREKRNNESYDVKFLTGYWKKYKSFPLFSQVLIETRTDCNKNCSFCPQSYVRRPNIIMKWRTYKTIIDQLGKINYSGRVALMVSNEPLLEPRLIKMIRYAKKVSALFFVDITTNGRLLDESMLLKLFSAGLDNITINDYQPILKIKSRLFNTMKQYINNPKIDYRQRQTDEGLLN